MLQLIFKFDVKVADLFFLSLRSIPDILSNIPPYPPEVSEVQYVAGQIADTMVDPRFSDSKVRLFLYIVFILFLSYLQFRIIFNVTVFEIHESSE